MKTEFIENFTRGIAHLLSIILYLLVQVELCYVENKEKKKKNSCFKWEFLLRKPTMYTCVYMEPDSILY